MHRQRPELPIDAILGEIERALDGPGRNLVVQAAPGAGKTTAIPLRLLDSQGILEKRRAQGLASKVLVLEPRKIAARMAASTCAQWGQSELGDRIGYQVRFERAAGPQTQLCFVTQALYLRMLTGNAQIPDYGVIVFDEFHERNLSSDLALALTLELQRSSRPDLQIVVMSATLDAEPVARYLDAPVFSHEGASFPITIHHLAYQRKQAEQGGPSLLRCLSEMQKDVSQGHILVFLPGIASIERQAQSISAWAKSQRMQIHRLHGSMSKQEQQAVVAPSEIRKIILATNVAESSVTIPGVTAVVDFGLAKISRSDLLTGKTILEERRISRACAIQRSGRAGRTAPGHAYRLYSEGDFSRRAAFDSPEVQRLDPVSALLTLCALGHNPQSFAWFEAPKAGALTHALERLRQLDFLDESGITPLGRIAAQLPLDPMAARSVIELARVDLEIAAKTAALLAIDDKQRRALEKLRPTADACDLLAELSAWRLAEQGKGSPQATACAKTLAQHRASIAKTLRRQATTLKALGPGLHENFDKDSREDWIRCALALGYAQALGKIDAPGRPGGRIVMARGQSAQQSDSSIMRSESPWVVVLSAHQRASTNYADRLSAVEEEWLLELGSNVEQKIKLSYDDDRQEVNASQALTIGQLVIEEEKLSQLPPSGVDLLFKKSMAAGLNHFFELEQVEQLLARFAFLNRYRPELPTPCMPEVHAAWRELCCECRRFSELKNAAFPARFAQRYQEHLHSLDQLAPTHIRLASGRRLKLRYAGDREPGASTRLQDFFGLREGPTVMAGQVPVRLHLLAPNRRDVQVSCDLAGFWERHYPGLRKTLMRRYPKHAWPEDPITATPPAPRPARPTKKKK